MTHGEKDASTTTIKSKSSFYIYINRNDFFRRCIDCSTLCTTLDQIQSLVEKNTSISDAIRNRLLYRVNYCVQMITEWKKHLLRTIHQDAARKKVLDSLDDSSILLIADWAMKWLPTRYRESQRDFFGKRGLPWHITYAIRLDASSSWQSSNDRIFQHRTFCHVFDNVKQEGTTVISIISDVSC